MKSNMKSFVVYCSLLGFLILPAKATAWTKHLHFNDGADGVAAYGEDGFDDAAGGTTYDTEKSYEGGKSARLSVTDGATAFGLWGGIITHPTNLVKGDEIWVRVRTYMPMGFDYNSSGEGAHLKFLRVHTRSDASSNQGYDDWYINPTTRNSDVPHKFIFEGQQAWSNFGSNSFGHIVLGVWETYEMYLKLDNVAKDNGGEALVRFWKDGVLLGEATDRITLSTDSSYSDRTHIFTYWNGGAPKTQHMWLDDVVVTSDTPSSVDADGNIFVGMGPTNRPSSPSSLLIQMK